MQTVIADGFGDDIVAFVADLFGDKVGIAIAFNAMKTREQRKMWINARHHLTFGVVAVEGV
jgi:hypothetical protein